MEDDKIASVGAKKPEGIGNYIELDGTGKYLFPGLIYSHVHLSNSAGLDGPVKKKCPEWVELYYNQLPKSYLKFWVYYPYRCKQLLA